jgi:hypothetical protein
MCQMKINSSNLRFRLRLGGKDVILFDELVLLLLLVDIVVTIPIGLCDRLGGEAK